MVSHQRASSVSPGVIGPGRRHKTFSEGVARRPGEGRERTSSLSPAREGLERGPDYSKMTYSERIAHARRSREAGSREGSSREGIAGGTCDVRALREAMGKEEGSPRRDVYRPLTAVERARAEGMGKTWSESGRPPSLSPPPARPGQRSGSFSGSSSDFRAGDEEILHLIMAFDNRERK